MRILDIRVAFEFFLLGSAWRNTILWNLLWCIYQPVGVLNIKKRCQLWSWETRCKPRVYVNSRCPRDIHIIWKTENLCPWKSLFKEIFNPGAMEFWQISNILSEYTDAVSLLCEQWTARLCKVPAKSQGRLPSGGNVKLLLKYSHNLPVAICLQPNF